MYTGPCICMCMWVYVCSCMCLLSLNGEFGFFLFLSHCWYCYSEHGDELTFSEPGFQGFFFLCVCMVCMLFLVQSKMGKELAQNIYYSVNSTLTTSKDLEFRIEKKYSSKFWRYCPVKISSHLLMLSEPTWIPTFCFYLCCFLFPINPGILHLSCVLRLQCVFVLVTRDSESHSIKILCSLIMEK